MMYRASFQTSTYEADFRNRLRLSSVLNYMQEVAARNADQLGFGFRDFNEQGLFWVLSRTRILIDTYPEIGEQLIVETWPKSLHSLFAIRDFRFYNANGLSCGTATTAWIIMNQATRRPLRPESIMQNMARSENLHAIHEIPGKLDEPGNLVQVNEIVAAYSDIDVNQHVNNVKYLEYIMDSYPEDELSTLEINDFQINFLHECRFGEKIRIYKGMLGDEAYFEGVKPDGNKVFQALAKRKRLPL